MSINASDRPCVVLLGPPGAGKGAQARRLAATLGLVPIGTGDLLRAAVAAQTSLGRAAERHMRSGRLVPDGLIVDLVRERLGAVGACAGVLLDGFPRTIAQAEALDACLARLDRAVSDVIALDVGEEEIVARLSRGRFEAVGTGRAARADDRPEIVRERLRTYREQTAPLLGFFAARGLLQRLDGCAEPAALCEQITAAIGVAAAAASPLEVSANTSFAPAETNRQADAGGAVTHCCGCRRQRAGRSFR